MAARSFKPYIIILGLMVVTSLALAFTVDVNLVDQAGVNMKLPAQVGPWAGNELRFCQVASCQAQLYANEMTNREVCTKCGGKTYGLTKIEMDLLPHDTEGIKELFTTADRRQLMVAIVLSGRERASIHRPEVCMRGQGNAIRKSYVLDVPITNRAPLQVRVLEQVDEQNEKRRFYYAYWFVGKDRETPSHWQRMFWMASDRIFHNVSHRWAYISVAGVRTDDPKAYQDEIRQFVALLAARHRAPLTCGASAFRCTG